MLLMELGPALVLLTLLVLLALLALQSRKGSLQWPRELLLLKVNKNY